MPPQSFDWTTSAAAERSCHRPHKRRRESTPAQTICPEVIFIDEDVSDGQGAQSAIDSIKHFTWDPQDDDDCTGLEYGPFLSYGGTPDAAIPAPESADDGDTSDMDIAFERCLRSPSVSPSLSPDDAASEVR